MRGTYNRSNLAYKHSFLNKSTENKNSSRYGISIGIIYITNSGIEKNKGGFKLEDIEQSLISLKPEHNKLVRDYSNEFNTLPKDRQLFMLSRDNKQIREHLKLINKFMTSLLDHRRSEILINFSYNQ